MSLTSFIIAIAVSFAAGVFVYRWIVKSRKSAHPDRRATAAPVGEQPSMDALLENSLRDTVTALYNRKHLLQRLQSNIARCDREDTRMAVILWDIDGFVDFNNRFGQQEGDRFLKKVAETVTRSIRSYDEAFRVGPDEFCAVLAPADETVAAEVTRRVSDSVSKNLFGENSEYAGKAFSISAGVVFYPGDHKMPEAILHEAGQALYRGRMSRV